MKRFDNKTVLVTGGTGGIGLATVKEFLNEGAFVYFTDVSDKRGLKLEKELGQNAKFLKHDVTSEKDWISVIKHISNEHKQLDVLANIAGVIQQKFIEELTYDEFMKVIGVNQAGVFLGQKYGVELLKNSKYPAIVNIASIAGLKGGPAGAAYNSSKAAVISLTETAAHEFSTYNIRVNSISPGVIETSMTDHESVKDLIEQMVKTTPIKRKAQPSEIARVVLFLSSKDASFITGSNIIVDGGASKL